MRRLACLLTIFLAAPLTASAQDSAAAMDAGPEDGTQAPGVPDVPVVVEFYTSQGCLACPPADAIFAQLTRDKDVIGLALHVDYWDYLGWADEFARPEFTKRQKGYARVMRQRTLFTPQMVIQGEDLLVGRDAGTIADRINAHRREPATSRLSLSREPDDWIRVTLSPVDADVGPADVHLFSYLPAAEVAIEAGDNAGQTVDYTNIAQSWNTIAHWDGASELEIDYGPVPPGPLAVLVQRPGLGTVMNAARIEE